MKDFADAAPAASETLLRTGFALIRPDRAVRAGLDELFAEADAFFARDAADKAAFSQPDILEGYRGFGAEFSGSEDRPDLNETFSLAPANQSRPDIAAWRSVNRLHAAMARIAPYYCALADGVLRGVRDAVDAGGDLIVSEDFSYLQLNYYRPRSERRDLLQDAHEDGHLLTIVTSRQPGLEIEVDGRFEAASLAPDELLVMPGSILTLMTGGRVAPLVHRVRNVPGLRRRASLMFFVNASVTRPIRAWAPAADGGWPDIRQATIASSRMFGLGSIEALAR